MNGENDVTQRCIGSDNKRGDCLGHRRYKIPRNIKNKRRTSTTETKKEVWGDS